MQPSNLRDPVIVLGVMKERLNWAQFLCIVNQFNPFRTFDLRKMQRDTLSEYDREFLLVNSCWKYPERVLSIFHENPNSRLSKILKEHFIDEALIQDFLFTKKELEKATYDHEFLSDYRAEFFESELLDTTECLAKRMCDGIDMLYPNCRNELSFQFLNKVEIVNASYNGVFRKFHSIDSEFYKICPDLSVNFEILAGLVKHEDSCQQNLWEFGVELASELLNTNYENKIYFDGEECGFIKIHQTEYFAYYFEEDEFFDGVKERENNEFLDYMREFRKSLLEQSIDSIEFDDEREIRTINDIEQDLFIEFWSDNVCLNVFYEIEGSFINEKTKGIFNDRDFEHVHYIPSKNKIIVEVSSLWSEYGDFDYDSFFEFVTTLFLAIKKGEKDGV